MSSSKLQAVLPVKCKINPTEITVRPDILSRIKSNVFFWMQTHTLIHVFTVAIDSCRIYGFSYISTMLKN